jgi:hypothetical protein
MLSSRGIVATAAAGVLYGLAVTSTLGQRGAYGRLGVLTAATCGERGGESSRDLVAGRRYRAGDDLAGLLVRRSRPGAADVFFGFHVEPRSVVSREGPHTPAHVG